MDANNIRQRWLSEVTVSGTLQYVENGTGIPDIDLFGYVVNVDDVANIPGSAASGSNIFGTVLTDSNGNFSINGTMGDPAAPGYASIVLRTLRNGYVGNDGLDLGVFINITDDSIVTTNLPAKLTSQS